jgi:hypothetical protein
MNPRSTLVDGGTEAQPSLSGLSPAFRAKIWIPLRQMNGTNEE